MAFKEDELLKFKYDHYNRKFNHSLDHLPFTTISVGSIGLICAIWESNKLNLNELPSAALMLGGFVAGGALMLTPAVLKYFDLKKIKQAIIKYCENDNNECIADDEKLKLIYKYNIYSFIRLHRNQGLTKS